MITALHLTAELYPRNLIVRPLNFRNNLCSFFLRKFKGLTIRLQMGEDDTRRKITKGAEKSLSSWVSFLSSLQALPLSLSSCLTTGQTGRMGARYGCLALAAIRLVEQISFCVFELSGDGSTWEIAQPTVPESVTPNSWKANWCKMQIMHFFTRT